MHIILCTVSYTTAAALRPPRRCASWPVKFTTLHSGYTLRTRLCARAMEETSFVNTQSVHTHTEQNRPESRAGTYFHERATMSSSTITGEIRIIITTIVIAFVFSPGPVVENRTADQRLCLIAQHRRSLRTLQHDKQRLRCSVCQSWKKQKTKLKKFHRKYVKQYCTRSLWNDALARKYYRDNNNRT